MYVVLNRCLKDHSVELQLVLNLSIVGDPGRVVRNPRRRAMVIPVVSIGSRVGLKISAADVVRLRQPSITALKLPVGGLGGQHLTRLHQEFINN
mmetsp:Transcript_6749/g.14665  ORF Transcript_6749/g.14665 Transcript_6749/m.14665 type:complete len:94 (-) Transcript_6749:196-477(-)